MFLKYKPDGEEEQRWTFKLGKLRTMEIEAIEKVTSLNYGSDFAEALLKGNARARRALLWTFLRREHPTLKFADVDFADDELVLEQDQQEWAEARANVEKATHLDEAEREEILAAMEAAAAEAEPAPGKAPGPSDDSSTPSP